MGRTEWSVTNLNCPFVENAATLSYLVHAGRRSPVAGGCDARRQRDRGRAKLNELREISESATYLLPRSQSLIPFCVATIRYILWFKDIGVHVAYKKNTPVCRCTGRRCAPTRGRLTWNVTHWFPQSIQFGRTIFFWIKLWGLFVIIFLANPRRFLYFFVWKTLF